MNLYNNAFRAPEKKGWKWNIVEWEKNYTHTKEYIPRFGIPYFFSGRETLIGTILGFKVWHFIL